MLAFIRYGLPAVLFVAAFVVLFTAGKANAVEGWAMLVGASLALLLLNVLYRVGAAGDKERDDEEAARRFLAEHGHWPDESPSKRRR
ncbi:MAG: hypothetical protein ACR2NB_11110 [Solirubrobacteraceae bacterium]